MHQKMYEVGFLDGHVEQVSQCSLRSFMKRHNREVYFYRVVKH